MYSGWMVYIRFRSGHVVACDYSVAIEVIESLFADIDQMWIA